MGLKKKKVAKVNVKPTRKEARKEKRKAKKLKRSEYYSKAKNPAPVGSTENVTSTLKKGPIKHEKCDNKTKNVSHSKILSTEQQHQKEKREQKRLQKDMSKQRKEQLLKANLVEDQTIRKLEKQLKLHKRKTKSIPKSFSVDGLDYLLEVCDPEYMKNAASAEQDLAEANDEFEEDFVLMTGDQSKKSNSQTSDDDMDDFETLLNEDDASEGEGEDLEGISEEEEEVDSDEELVAENNALKDKRKLESPPLKKSKLDLDESSAQENEDSIMSESSEADKEKNKSNVWEDIYGRLRSKDGAVLNNVQGKYIPPPIRAKLEATSSDDTKRLEKLARLKKQLKGLLNRLAESNMHNIAGQIEALYMNNSRNDMNETLTSLITDSLITNILTPERLLIEHVVLVAVLHANVGVEVGAHFLQTIIKRFETLCKTSQNIEDKHLDNVVNTLAQLYNFKVFDAKLLYEVIDRLIKNFDEKNVECILHILRSVGFGLRKDDPIALKNLILELQKQAASASEGKINNSRVKFLLDIILAIKNNNVTKIPNYDTSYSEHLKKIMKGFIRKGNYVTPLNISLEDLLKADERGKWWVVGSAWTGNLENLDKKENSQKSDVFSQQLLDLARKQRMNTDARRDIFCVIMSAEDYLDAFEKLLRLGLKHQQEREIIHVLLHCCLQEKVYNPYYAVLAQKFCDYDRKFQMTIRCSVWDKLKALNDHSGNQVSNLAKLLIHLFIEKGLPISTLKIVEFAELDKITLRFIRQILLGILLHNDLEAVQGVFEKVAQSDKLKMFRESLRLFIHHFLLKKLQSGTVPEEKKRQLEERAKMVEKILTAKESRLRF